MTRRIVASLAWLLTASMGALVILALVDWGFLESVLVSLPADQRPPESMIAVSYAAIAMIIAVTLAYATVGLLLASRRGGGRLGAILLTGAAAFTAIPFGYIVGARSSCATLSTRSPTCCSSLVRRRPRSGTR